MDFLTQVHTEETSRKFHVHPSYRSYRESFVKDELEATYKLYSQMDGEEGCKRTTLLDKCRRMAWFMREKSTGRVFVASSSCRLRWCPMCARSRASVIATEVKSWLKVITTPRFFTFTLKHSDDSLQDQIERLYDCFRKIRKLKQFKKRVHGGVWFFQVKLNTKKDQWHPHIHCVYDGKFFPKEELSKLWYKVTSDSYIVDVRIVNDKSKSAEYIARYSARPSNLMDYDPELQIEIYKAMHGKRLCGTWGTAKDVKLSPSKTIEFGLYEKVGSWFMVINLLPTEPSARKIFKAWLSGDTITEKDTVMHLDNFIDELPQHDHVETDKHIKENPILFT